MVRKGIKYKASVWIKELTLLAQNMEIEGNYDLEKKYVDLILEISKHYKVKIPNKIYICKNCKSILIPGRNATVRLKKGRINLKCLRCGKIKRYVI